jgi:DnaJ-class molecular chaperone
MGSCLASIMKCKTCDGSTMLWNKNEYITCFTCGGDGYSFRQRKTSLELDLIYSDC